MNATRAAIRAGYSEKSAHVIGYENLSKPYIADYIADLREKAREGCVASFQEKRELLWETAVYGASERFLGTGEKDEESAMRQRAPSAAVAAIRELNAMDGDHAAIKQEIKDVTPPIIEYVCPDEDTADSSAA